jgi:hypothetical protein
MRAVKYTPQGEVLGNCTKVVISFLVTSTAGNRLHLCIKWLRFIDPLLRIVAVSCTQ